MRRTSLKRTKRGYVRNLGRMQDGSQPKFYLGHDREQALRRLDMIVALWQQIEEKHRHRPDPPVWDSDRFEAAKAVAKGEIPALHRGDKEQPEKYFERVNETRRSLGIDVQPADEFLYRVGLQDLVGDNEKSAARLSSAVGVPGATGQTLHQALRGYQEYLQREYLDTDGLLTDNGRTKVEQIKTIVSYVPDPDLAALDYHGCDEIFGIFRRRPMSKRYKKPMARKSCTNYIGELGRFFRWLHLSNQFRWRKPEDFELIDRRPIELDEDVEKEAADVPTWTIEQLKKLNEYATPLERVFLLLGLNCAYGADQAGRLRISHLRLSPDGHSYIRRVRRKKKTRAIHLLWQQTADGLRWALERRKGQQHEKDFLLLTDEGQPYWKKTKGGHRSQLIPNLWTRLIARIQKDDRTFPHLPFNSLRDTSADLIRQLAGEEIASLHLAHKHQSKDENLGSYTNPVRKRHFRAIRKLENKLEAVLSAAGPEPWAERPKSYIGRAKIKKLLQLREQGVKATEIAKKLDISVATVYRYKLPNKQAGCDDEPCDKPKDSKVVQ